MGKALKIPLCAAIGLLLVVVVVLTCRPDFYIRFMQAHGFVDGDVNRFETEQKQTQKTLQSGIVCFENINYQSKYPNGLLDLYLTPTELADKAPIFFYIHGGGYVGGDKAEGDPNAAGTQDATKYLQLICESGYNVVSINYALAPDYNYPIPVYQIDEAVRFLAENAQTYGIDASRMVFSGGGAGGQLAGQYVNIQTNPAYAQEFGMEPFLGKEGVLGVVLNSALLEPKNFEKTDKLTNCFMFFEMKQQYFQRNEQFLKQGDVIQNLSKDFPPAFITDGNYGTFDAQAKRLDAALNALGVFHVFNYYERSRVRLEHGYDSYLENEYAQDNLLKQLEFLEGLK